MEEIEYFLKSKEKALTSLNKAKNDNKLDQDIEEIINTINLKKEYFTSSCCSGRIVILELPELGNKREAKFLGKWHRDIQYNELIEATKQAKTGMIWLLAQSPIIHVITNSYSLADNIIKIAINSGFKNSGYKSIKNNIVVEICSTERLDSPIGNNGKLSLSNEHLKFLLTISNFIIKKSKTKLKKLQKNLKKKL
jgi:tRNA wybutosine-synthesizing protein 3